MTDLFGVVKTARVFTDRVLVAYSCGKDSVVTLDVCKRYFPNVQAYFMYQVPGLEFQERTLRWAEERYGIEVIRIPHFEVSDFFRYGTYHNPTDCPAVSIADVYAYLRQKTGAFWIAAGERIADSTVRRAMIVKRGTIDKQRGRIYPVAHWTKAHVLSYIRQYGLRTAEEAKVLGTSFGDLRPRTMGLIKQHYPDDYERILAMYPLAGAGAAHWEMYGAKGRRSWGKHKQVPEVRDAGSEP